MTPGQGNPSVLVSLWSAKKGTNSPSVMAANLASAYAEGFMIYIDSMGPKDHKK